ncbi:MAG: glycoside hydrolase family 11 protein [Defluviitaleaceae bacterium]|nr:glycoside hydrolase family 11 protein [Defluviitaleaceae bacterium]
MKKILKRLATLAVVFAIFLGIAPYTAEGYMPLSERTIAHRFTAPPNRHANNNPPAGRVNGFDFEAWTDDRGAEGMVMYVYSDGTFSGVWTQTYNTLFRTGRRWPNHALPTVSSVGNISLRYDVPIFTSGGGATYLTVYGWTRSPLIEWYIVERFIDWTPANSVPNNTAHLTPPQQFGNYTWHGMLEANGGVYDIMTGWRINQPSIDGTATFLQIFSVRRGSQGNRNQSNPTAGTIDVSAHFEAWSRIPPQTHGSTTMQFSGNSLLYEVSFTVEGFGGNNRSSGRGTVNELCIIYGANSICSLSGCVHCVPFVPSFYGEGTMTNPFQISSASHLEQLAMYVNAGDYNYNAAYYILTNDINLSALQISPIGNANNPFQGVFNGGGNTISNLNIQGGANVGLFGVIAPNGHVHNLAILDANINGTSDVGSLVGRVYGTVENISVMGVSSISGDTNVGGLAGNIPTGIIRNSISTAQVSGNSNVGGLAGTIAGTGTRIENSAAINPSISGSGTSIGRVTGNAQNFDNLSGNIAYMYMTGNFSENPLTSNGTSHRNGKSWTHTELYNDGTFDGRFVPPYWTTMNGHLPGLGGTTQIFPSFLLRRKLSDLIEEAESLYHNTSESLDGRDILTYAFWATPHSRNVFYTAIENARRVLGGV